VQLLNLHLKNTAVCPAVFEAMTLLEKRL